MNFFEQQDRAQRNTGRLVLLMALAVTSLIAITSLVLSLLWRFMGDNYHSGYRPVGIDWGLVGDVALVVIGVVLLGSLYKSLQMSGGGKAVVERLGGRLINLEPQGIGEQRLLNVVEEMAIASGIPVPPVYVLEDEGINAFAAGLTPQNAVIGITRGAIELLSRDELQGVIAHEFSHIFHGDMRLNTRLVSILHGILLLGLIGGFILRNLGSARSSRSDRNNSMALIIAVGVTLWVLGYAGTFFGNLIKAAVSRQREFLADASAVQFTRNPDGIGGALKKIGGHASGSQLDAAHAAEFSHMYFGAGISQALDGMMATHPPLEERIRRIEPGWDGQFPAVELAEPEEDEADEGEDERQEKWQRVLGGVAVATQYGQAAAEQSIAAIGQPQQAHLAQARQTLHSLPPALKSAAHSTLGAQAVVYGLLLSRDSAVQEQQFALLRPELEPSLLGVLGVLRDGLLSLDQGLRLPLLELALPALKQLAKAEFMAFKANLVRLIKADERVELLEWTLLRIVERHVEGPRASGGKLHLAELVDETGILLSALAHAGHADAAQAAAAFAEAGSDLPFASLSLRTAAEVPLKALNAALDRLSLLQPLQKPQLLKAMARCVGHDGQITATEAELMRAVAETLDCPMPPLLRGTDA
ncbi:peptidase M48 Ste24p [Pseudomonas alcaligenes]|uniref:Peptidase M48 Ste24p n=1 Tax=Aquipseudomonas alcaligenes TaxID=43263 RepID=A0ABR7S7S5_AQUAC|nr:M48 family metallopeptidase [Pseudomonas alcaligenes]MBC9252498.1 peptidase M48 Ste24p [Pseudomonas alcaligenes]